MKRMVTTMFLAALAAMAAAPAAAQTAEETKASVPELSAFHEVIYPMWHTAWPAKDTTMLRDLWPDIRKHVAAVSQAELPGILRDKQGAWEEGVERLLAAEKGYGGALEGGTLEAKLAAAEEMHSAYESLVRTIRPPMAELAAFHETLYRIFHYILPEKDQAKLVEILPELRERADALAKAPVPKRFERVKAEFDRARSDLAKKVTALEKAAPKRNWKKTAAAIEDMHTAYQAVEQVCD